MLITTNQLQQIYVCSIGFFFFFLERSESLTKIHLEEILMDKTHFGFGFKLKYNDNITIYHPTRKTFREIKRKYYRFGLGWGRNR